VGAAVNILCALTSFACAVLLLRGFVQRRVRLLLWSGLCFVGFAIGNVLLVVDTMVVPQTDLSLLRSLPVLAGLVVLIYGLVWDT
jgi:hydrogenase/urease accessory protein HupE